MLFGRYFSEANNQLIGTVRLDEYIENINHHSIAFYVKHGMCEHCYWGVEEHNCCCAEYFDTHKRCVIQAAKPNCEKKVVEILAPFSRSETTTSNQ